MDKGLLEFLDKQRSKPLQIDRLIISLFLYSNNICKVQNVLVKAYTILETDPDFNLFKTLRDTTQKISFEDLIQLFEFVISPTEKVVTGAVYTPEFIRNYIVENVLLNFQSHSKIKIADIACGCGGFLLTTAAHLHKITKRSFFDIYRDNLYGIDIADYSILRTKLILTLFSIINGEDKEVFEFNLFCDNSLTFDWRIKSKTIKNNGGFDAIVGNPPYVCSRNMEVDTLKIIKKMEVCRSGHPDLYIPFFQIGVENLNNSGILSFITVNTFVKSINGRALRQYFEEKGINLKIISFGGEQIFQNRNTYTCICIINKAEPMVSFIRTSADKLEELKLSELNTYRYVDLDHFSGWNLVNNSKLNFFIQKIESNGTPFSSNYQTKNGIATLKNDVYKFYPEIEDDNYYYIENYPIEKGICRDIINANKVRTPEDIKRLNEKIIFPYDRKIKILPPEVMKEMYPMALKYLESYKDALAERDKGNRTYEEWYAYGRRQSMDVNCFKLFFPHICDTPSFTICKDKDLLFYNGIAIVSENLEELEIIKKILESKIFLKYIKNTTKDYSSGYISMSRNYLKNFGIPNLDISQKKELLSIENADDFLSKIYGISQQDLQT